MADGDEEQDEFTNLRPIGAPGGGEFTNLRPLAAGALQTSANYRPPGFEALKAATEAYPETEPPSPVAGPLREAALGFLGAFAPETAHPLQTMAEQGRREMRNPLNVFPPYMAVKTGAGLGRQLLGAAGEVGPVLGKLTPGGGWGATISPDEAERAAHGLGTAAGTVAPLVAPEVARGLRGGLEAASPRGMLSGRMAEAPAGSAFTRGAVADAAAEHGVQLDIAQATEHRLATGAKAAGQPSIPGRMPYEKAQAANEAALEQWAESEAGKYAPQATTAEELGARMQKWLEARHEATKNAVAQGFEDLDRRVGANKVDVSDLQGQAQEVLDKTEQYYKHHPELEPKQAMRILRDLAAPAEGGKAKTMSWSDLHNLRSDLMDFYRNNPEIIKSRSQAWIQQMVGATDKAMTSAAAGLRPQDLAAFRRYNGEWENLKQTYDDPQSPFYSVMRTETASQIPKTLMGGRPETIAKALELLGPLAKDAQRYAVDSLLNGKDGVTLDLRGLNARLRRMPEDRLAAALGKDGARELRLLGQVSQKVTEVANPSKTGMVMVPAGELAGLLTHPHLAVPELAGQYALARAMTSAWLRDYLTGRGRFAPLGRPIRIAPLAVRPGVGGTLLRMPPVFARPAARGD